MDQQSRDVLKQRKADAESRYQTLNSAILAAEFLKADTADVAVLHKLRQLAWESALAAHDRWMDSLSSKVCDECNRELEAFRFAEDATICHECIKGLRNQPDID